MARAQRRKKRQITQKRIRFIGTARVEVLRARLARSGGDCMMGEGETVLDIYSTERAGQGG